MTRKQIPTDRHRSEKQQTYMEELAGLEILLVRQISFDQLKIL